MDILQSTDFWVVISFTTFFVLVFWKARGALTGAIDGRINRIRENRCRRTPGDDQACRTASCSARCQWWPRR